MSAPPLWAACYVGIPYKDNSASFEAVSCWGLCRLVLEQKTELKGLPEYASEDLIDAARLFKRAITGPPWVEVTDPRPFDCVLMTAMSSHGDKVHRMVGHVGILVSKTHLLHVWKETDSVIMSIRDPVIAPKIICYVRHQSLQR